MGPLSTCPAFTFSVEYFVIVSVQILLPSLPFFSFFLLFSIPLGINWNETKNLKYLLKIFSSFSPVTDLLHWHFVLQVHIQMGDLGPKRAQTIRYRLKGRTDKSIKQKNLKQLSCF